MYKSLTVEKIKSLGKEKSERSLEYLINLYHSEIPLELKREVVSSIGRQENKDVIFSFIKNNFYLDINSMDMVYQMYRTCLYNYNEDKFKILSEEIENFYDNEVIYKMKEFYLFKKNKSYFKETKSDIKKPTLLKGDCEFTLNKISEKSVKLIFTSPPYYNAKEYSSYKSYNSYLDKMKNILSSCYRVLEDGRFIIINVSPVISKRPGREFESIRYPIHFDFHRILSELEFEFIDEIIWLKPEYSVPNRNGGYMQTQMPLSYKPNCVTESIMVYRKKASFLLDKNIKAHKEYKPTFENNFDKTNCWLINPRSSKNHPAVFPEELCKKILHYYSFPNELVLDPFGGSGTFGDVAKDMNRIPLLCEQKNEYIEHILQKGYELLE